MQKISYTDLVRNEVLQSQEGEEYPAYNKGKEGLTRLVTSCVGTAFYNMLLKERSREAHQ
jgi:hypothetical protein